jgi:hypothetical protein
LLGVVMEAYVKGVSTRKVDHLVSELGIHMGKDQVSRICGELDEQVEAFRTRPLEGVHPYLWLDAKHLKVRDRGHVHSKALLVAFAVHESGRREVIGIEIAESETEAGCTPTGQLAADPPVHRTLSPVRQGQFLSKLVRNSMRPLRSEASTDLGTSSKKASPGERATGPGNVSVRLGDFAAEAISAGRPRPQRLNVIVDQAIRFYLGSDHGEAGWAFPKFLGVERGEGSEVEVEVREERWAQLSGDAARQEVEPEDLLQHAVLYFAAARDGGRLTTQILEVVDGEAGPGR